MSKSATKHSARKTRANPPTASKRKARNQHHKPAARVAAEMARENYRKSAAPFEQFPVSQVPNSS